MGIKEKVCQWLAADQWCFPGTKVFPINKTWQTLPIAH
jgi:hypothetical protein